MKNPLLDIEFLSQLHNYRQREVFARITLLNQNEMPIEYIEGRVTAGSINVDGNSALRRTCNLTMTLKDQSEINQFYWTFQSKFKLEVGLKNMIDCEKYPEIIWFPQGVFILTTCNMSQTTNNYTITINGKDKMCKLNGDLGGNIVAQTDFGTLEEVDADGNITYTKLLLKDIIREMLINQGGELASNIIINDLDDAGFELMEYRYEDKPLYLFRDIGSGDVINITLNGDMTVYDTDKNAIKLSQIAEEELATLSNLQLSTNMAKKICLNKTDTKIYNVMRYQYGDLAGYRLTDLTYAGELTANIGDTIVSVLDKITKMLGNFEYFYNLDGRFVFQKKNTYISTPWGASEKNDEDNVFNLINDSRPLINLTDAKLTTSFSNNPNLLNVKNDYSVWGTYKSISGTDIPIHMRYAIDKKPTSYHAFRPVKIVRTNDNAIIMFDRTNYDYFNNNGWLKKSQPVVKDGINYLYDYLDYEFLSSQWDWRELIYQMALDYYKCRTDEDFYITMMQKNPWTAPTGRTGYEQYYTDIQGFWRQLYNPTPEAEYLSISASEISTIDDLLYVNKPYIPLDKTNFEIKTKLENGEINADNVYVIRNDTANGRTKSVFVPFIGSPECHLAEGAAYYYKKGDKFIETTDSSILNTYPLKSLYCDIGDGKKDIFVNYKFNNAINDTTAKLWIRSDKKIKFADLDKECQNVYCGGDYQLQLPINTFVRWNTKDNYGNLSDTMETSEIIEYYKEDKNGGYYGTEYSDRLYWNEAVFNQPGTLFFWFDFLDAEGSEIFDKYSVKSIGDRTKTVNDNNVKSIYYRDVPNIIFVENIAEKLKYNLPTGYTYIQISETYQPLFSISGRGISAKERIDELFNAHSYCIEQSNITSVPLYHLEPNMRVYVRDDASKIDGEYMVSKFTIPLAYNGTMTLTANKVVSTI